MASSTVAPDRFSVVSKDGVYLSVRKGGSGPALVLVHGAATTSASWLTVWPLLSSHFTLYAMDRRGRPPSGDQAQYSIAKEADDLAAVIAAIGEPVTLVAHSYGALITVSGFGQLEGVSRLVLYEPPLYVPPRPAHLQMNEEVQRAWQAGDRELVVTTFLGRVVGPEALAAFRASPAWPNVLQLAGTIAREVQEVSSFRPVTSHLTAWSVPTTMLAGSESPDYMHAASAFVCRAVQNCRTLILEGQSHVAMLLAPELFAAKVLEAAGPAP
jgi:pimeloyl-ACP methyl ester carboxylesterase